MKLVPLLVLLLAGCVSAQPVAWPGVGEGVNGRAITLQGTIESSPVAGTWHLCPKGQPDLTQCVDVIESPTTIAALQSGICLSISGRFTAFSSDVVGIGNFRSSIGYLEVTNARACHER